MIRKKIINFLKFSLGLTLSFSFIFLSQATAVEASELSYQLRGFFLIQVEDKGQAWYVDQKNGLRHYLSEKGSLSNIVARFGLGVSNSDLAKIPIAVDSRLIVMDSDGDGLDDKLERAIGADSFKADSDSDGYPDSLEIFYHFNPLGSGRLLIDKEFSSKLAGNILLQTENHGEAWYLNPKDNLRYYIADDQALFKIIRYLGKGISNDDLSQVADGILIDDRMPKNIKIDVGPKQRLYYYLGDVQLGSFPISAGKAISPTPKGNFKIINKHPKAWSPYGLWMPYWLGLGTGRFGIHELPIWPNGYREGQNHLGIPVSHGCIRLGIGPAKFLYNWVEIGTLVNVY